MPNPYAAATTRRAHESVTELDLFVGRLATLRATDDEIAQVVAGWDVFDDDWTPARRRQFVRATDSQIVADLAALRSEYRAVQGEPNTVMSEAAAVVDRSAAKVVEWVDGDPERAKAALTFERMSPDGGRKTLIATLTRIAG